MTEFDRSNAEPVGGFGTPDRFGVRWPLRHLWVLPPVLLLVALSGCRPAEDAAPTPGEEVAAATAEDAAPASTCPDLTGQWSSAVFLPLKVFEDGSRETQGPTSTTLEVVYQDGCQFQAVNSWSSGELGGSEPVAGTVSAATGAITMAEVGPHPEGGSSALITARLVGADEMTWEYVGLADDDSRGQVFTTELVRR